jgi:hypothetical protein
LQAKANGTYVSANHPNGRLMADATSIGTNEFAFKFNANGSVRCRTRRISGRDDHRPQPGRGAAELGVELC